jgi:hypothetical protein
LGYYKLKILEYRDTHVRKNFTHTERVNIRLWHFKFPPSHFKFPLWHFKFPLSHFKFPLSFFKSPPSHLAARAWSELKLPGNKPTKRGQAGNSAAKISKIVEFISFFCYKMTGVSNDEQTIIEQDYR